ncbi:MAG TPA: HAMP domain-containing protein, partial [Mycobacterium sp.]
MKRHTIRTRIALVFGTAFLAIGALLLGGVYLLTQHGTDAMARDIAVAVPAEPAMWMPVQPVVDYSTPGLLLPSSPAATVSFVSSRVSEDVANAASRQQLLWSGVALAAAALLAAVVGWWAAARVLRPVHQMTTTVRRIGATSLDERLGNSGPRDEITELADTFDDLLDRLQASFTAQRRFTANASHELRTPLAVQRSLIQVGLEDPSPDELEQVRTEL